MWEIILITGPIIIIAILHVLEHVSMKLFLPVIQTLAWLL